MNIAYKSISGIDFIYPERIKDKAKYIIVLNCFIFLIGKKCLKSCKIQSILVKYSEIMKLEASKSSTFNFLESIYNINNNLILRKRLTDPFILDCKLLLRLKKKIRSLKLHPKPK